MQAMQCAMPRGNGEFVVGEMTSQPRPPPTLRAVPPAAPGATCRRRSVLRMHERPRGAGGILPPAPQKDPEFPVQYGGWSELWSIYILPSAGCPLREVNCPHPGGGRSCLVSSGPTAAAVQNRTTEHEDTRHEDRIAQFLGAGTRTRRGAIPGRGKMATHMLDGK